MPSPAQTPERFTATAAAATFAEQWDVRLPVVNAPMGGVAGGRLAAAVTAGGGFGMIGMGSAGSAMALRRELRFTAATEGRFGIGMVDWVAAADPEMFEVALAAAPALLTVGFGTDLTWARRAASAGIRTAAQVYTRDDARRAEDSGIDIVVARGAEGGGHGSTAMAMLPLLDAVLDAVSVPVLAAGGIGTPASMAAVLAAGASGVWLGTRLAASAESLLPEAARRALIAATGADTVATTIFDTALELPWPERFPSRVLRNEVTRDWSDRAAYLRTDPESRTRIADRVRAGDPTAVPVDAGQGVGAVTAVEPAAQIIGDLSRAAAQLLTRPQP
ncbi:NAD(P)H-dependent flavin oxidoreductase [Nocardia bovistercoris]|uniref:Nitronate monooxygenase n=1 Tax=Nocardia bovistercoris TaxID=2785916 RepID=A0A931IC98_9NOCA|nr:nitronate monooxygenase [Nocardia bovistercoris]MBH0777901.1 nitronate monooxygenase [Nocardia bovistercoris]